MFSRKRRRRRRATERRRLTTAKTQGAEFAKKGKKNNSELQTDIIWLDDDMGKIRTVNCYKQIRIFFFFVMWHSNPLHTAVAAAEYKAYILWGKRAREP